MKHMKIPVAIVVLTAIVSFAQPKPSGHLSFKGVPIDGTLSEYVSKMKQNGFSLIGMEDGMAILQGDFAAYKNCTIGVSTLTQKDLVSKISVAFPNVDTWSLLSNNYFSLKDMLTEKYGQPSDCVEEFQTEYGSDDDNSKMHEVKMDRCKYITVFETKNGSIELSISHSGFIYCCVILSYFDKINGDIINSKAKDDL